MRRVSTPEAGRTTDVDHPVHVPEAVASTPSVFAPLARRARSTRLEALDCDPIARGDLPSLGSPGAQCDDSTDGLVPGDEREARAQSAGEELVIGSAEATRLDLQDRIVVADGRDRERLVA
jgi:hypothetical protein